MTLSVRSISVQLAKCKMSGKDPLKTAYLFARLREHKSRLRQNRPRNGRMDKPTKNGSNFLLSFVCRCVAVEASGRAYFAQGRTIDREGQYPWVLASGGVMPLRKSRRISSATNQAKKDRATGNKLRRKKRTTIFAVLLLSV